MQLAEGLECPLALDVVAGADTSVVPVPRSRRERHAGWYVRRLEICAPTWTDELARDAARVVRACPNVRAVTVGSEDESPVPDVLVSAIAEICPHTLRALDWTCGLHHNTISQVLQGICAMTELRSLFLCIDEFVDAVALKGLLYSGHISLPNLHTLEMVSCNSDPSEVLVAMASWDLPALQQVTLTGQEELINAGPFFEAHGHKLKTLEFDYAGEMTPIEEGSPLPMDHLEPQSGPEILLSKSSNLAELVLQLHWAQVQAASGHPTVKYIGLRGLHLMSHNTVSPYSYNSVSGGMILRPDQDFEQQTAVAALSSLFPLLLSSITTRTDCKCSLPLPQCTCRSSKLTLYPSLRVVRLLDFDQGRFTDIPWRAKRVAFLRIWVKRFEEKGVRLEDHRGDLIRVVFREVRVLLPEDERDWKRERGQRGRIEHLVSRLAAAAAAATGVPMLGPFEGIGTESTSLLGIGTNTMSAYI